MKEPKVGDDLLQIPADLESPPTSTGEPEPGRRVAQTLPAWKGSPVHHALYLPRDWQPDRRFPVIVEYAGNGGYRSDLGDVCTGRVEDSALGYGLSGGRGMIWACAPFVEDGCAGNATRWWGDRDLTVRYCVALVREICERWSGDAAAVFVAGFSRGALATSYIGLHDEEVASLWRGFIAHSHFDGAYEGWGYPECDRPSARRRLARLAGRPLFVSHEDSAGPGLPETRAWISDALSGDRATLGAVTFCPLPFRNHTDTWVLRDIPGRRALRAWLDRVLG